MVGNSLRAYLFFPGAGYKFSRRKESHKGSCCRDQQACAGFRANSSESKLDARKFVRFESAEFKRNIYKIHARIFFPAIPPQPAFVDADTRDTSSHRILCKA